MIIRLKVDRSRIIGRKPTELYPLLTPRINPDFFKNLLDRGEHVLVQSVIQLAVIIRISSLWASLRYGYFCTPLTDSFVFAIVALSRKRGVHCISEDVALLGDVGLYFCGGLLGYRGNVSHVLLRDKRVQWRF